MVKQFFHTGDTAIRIGFRKWTINDFLTCFSGLPYDNEGGSNCIKNEIYTFFVTEKDCISMSPDGVTTGPAD